MSITIPIDIYNQGLETPYAWLYWEEKKYIPEPSFRKESAWLLECNTHPSDREVFSTIFIQK